MPSGGTGSSIAAALICAATALQLLSHGESRPNTSPYYGSRVGVFKSIEHKVTGAVYAVDETTLFIKGFTYDGTAPDAYFWVGNTARPSPDGYIVPYPEDFVGRDPPILGRFHMADVILKLPLGKRVRDIQWLSVWCRRFTVNFGEVFIPGNLDVPKARVLPEFRRLAHGLRSGNISVLDAKTFYIPNLHYDGTGPDAYFWVGNGSEPSPLGIKVPNEVGSLDPLRGYQGEDIEIQLPGNLTVYDIDWLAVWCVQYRHNFGHVNIPKDLDVPPALGQTKITTSSTPASEVAGFSMSNCREMLDERLQVQWEMSGDYVMIALSARIREDQYMAFGLSGDNGRATMVGGDIVVAYMDSDNNTFHAVDYYMSSTAQCDGQAGVCPDARIGGHNDVVTERGERRNGVTTVVYRRPLQTNEPIKDRPIPADGEVSVIAAIGPLNSRKEANAHAVPDKNTDDMRIDFSSRQDLNCPSSLYDLATEENVVPWVPKIISMENVFSARIGPAGGKKGYTPITGHPSRGVSWWINDLMIPEVYVERGQTYTFYVEGGNDHTNQPRYHPFYITDNSEGGFGQKSEAEQKRQRVFAGVNYDAEGYPYPTAAGRYCEWTHTTTDMWSESETFEDYFKTLRLSCGEGEPAVLNWTVAPETPDELYYQCYTHPNLGWKIHVVDPGKSVKSTVKSSSAAISLSDSLSTAVLLLSVLLPAITS